MGRFILLLRVRQERNQNTLIILIYFPFILLVFIGFLIISMPVSSLTINLKIIFKGSSKYSHLKGFWIRHHRQCIYRHSLNVLPQKEGGFKPNSQLCSMVLTWSTETVFLLTLLILDHFALLFSFSAY